MHFLAALPVVLWNRPEAIGRIICQRHSEHLFSNPLCGALSTEQKAINIAFHILTACIPLMGYHLYRWYFTKKEEINLFEEEPALLSTMPTESNSAAPEDPTCCLFKIEKLGKNAMLYATTFLHRKERMQLVKCSKEFRLLGQENAFWAPVLRNLRIFPGALVPEFVRHDHVLKVATGNNAILQLKMYKKLNIQTGFFNDIVRLMPGGPLAFEKIPIHESSFFQNGIPLENMSGPLARDKNCQYLALCVIDEAERDPKPVVLVLKGTKNSDFFNNLENRLWGRDALRMNVRDHFNYILRIIQGTLQNDHEDLGELSKTIRLIRPVEVVEEKENASL